MSVLSTFSSQDFNNQREQWELLLKKELKLTEVGNKAYQQSLDAGAWPTLSLERKAASHIPVQSSWRKAAQTYAYLNVSTIAEEIKEDLSQGVRNFFFHKSLLSQETWKKISDVFASFGQVDELEVFLLGDEEFSLGACAFKVIDESSFFSGRAVHDQGGNNLQELGLLTANLIKGIDKSSDRLYLAVFTDSQFFRTIAKIRAAKLLAYRVLEELELIKEVVVVALTSYREWTLYERYSNMLRNDAAVAAAYIAGADHVQSSGYNTLWELELGERGQAEHRERSLRMARNSSHILALESMLGVVQDAAFGSYHLENLTEHYAGHAWQEMQALLVLSPEQCLARVAEESRKIREKRLEAVKNRRHILAGMNDFPDPSERLELKKAPQGQCFRIAQAFEGLRLKMEGLKHRPHVWVGIFGDYAALNARLNFVKNYFQLLGLEVHEVMNADELARKQGIIVLCAPDDQYPTLKLPQFGEQDKFIAGKYELAGHQNIYAGQNVYDVLEGVVNRWSAK